MDKSISSKRILKIATFDWKNASRDKRELEIVRKLGADVLILAKGDQTGTIDEVDGFRVYRVTTRPLGNRIPNTVNRIVSIFTWAWHTRRIAPQIISGHDMFAVLIGYFAGMFMPKKRRPKLVYDSHEFEIGRNAKRNKLQILAITYLERFLIKRCEFTIVVNDSIADEVQKIKKRGRLTFVETNIHETWDIDD